MNKNKFNITSIVILLFLFFVVGIIVGFCMKQPVQAANTTTLTETTDSVTENTSVAESTTEESTTEATTIYIAPVTTTEVELTTVKFEDIPELTELGTFKLTAYCICQECCGKSPDHPEYGITASGTRATPGRSVAVDTSVIPFGTKLYINGNTYIAEDTGKLVKGNVVDICFDNHREAELFGYKYAKVFEVIG